MADLDMVAHELALQLEQGLIYRDTISIVGVKRILEALKQAHAAGYREAVEAHDARQKLLDSVPG